jgi:hypothetical protein
LYFECYDKDRNHLLAAYHPKALFSISLNVNSQAAAASATPYYSCKFGGEYFKESRNLVHVIVDEEKTYKRLHHSNIQIITILNKLPSSEHLPDSFKLDVSLYMVVEKNFICTLIYCIYFYNNQ